MADFPVLALRGRPGRQTSGLWSRSSVPSDAGCAPPAARAWPPARPTTPGAPSGAARGHDRARTSPRDT